MEEPEAQEAGTTAVVWLDLPRQLFTLQSMGNALTADDICDLTRWAQVIAPDLYFESTGPGEGRILVPNAQSLTDSPVLQRHIRYHARLERAK